MRGLLVSFLFSITLVTLAQQPLVKSGVYAWPEQSLKKEKSIELFTGSAKVLEYFGVLATSLTEVSQPIAISNDEETLLLVKSGLLEIAFKDTTCRLGPGSIALVMPGHTFQIRNAGQETVQYHSMVYRGKDLTGKGDKSFVKDWNGLTFKPHDRGGVRPYFDRPTAMTKRFEMHATTLNAGMMSHLPHTHGAEEIILVQEGKVEMLIGDKLFTGTVGDVFFVQTNQSHNLKNIGNGPCRYFAFQWE